MKIKAESSLSIIERIVALVRKKRLEIDTLEIIYKYNGVEVFIKFNNTENKDKIENMYEQFRKIIGVISVEI